MARWGNVKTALDGLDNIVNGDQDRAEGRTYLRREKPIGQRELCDISYRYKEDGAPALEISAVILQPEQAVAVLGSTGSGKSTQLRRMSGLYAPTSGRVLYQAAKELNLLEKMPKRKIVSLIEVTRTVLLSPLRGIGNTLSVTTIGGVVRPGEEILQIIPLDEELFVEARVQPENIVSIRRRQAAHSFCLFGARQTVVRSSYGAKMEDGEHDKKLWVMRCARRRADGCGTARGCCGAVRHLPSGRRG